MDFNLSIKCFIRPKNLENDQNSFIWKTTLIALAFIVSNGCQEKNTQTKMDVENQSPASTKVIFETDMGNDIDDALALDMLYKYADQGKVELLAVNSNKDNEYSIRYIDILNTWYGYPEIPIGKVTPGADSEGDSKNYAQITWEYNQEGKQTFTGSLSDYSKVPDAVQLYREILAQQSDSSVTIISVGFSSNLARLLDSEADEFSELEGKELIEKKVKLLSVMAGNFEEDPIQEYNVVKDITSAQKVFAEWPTRVVVSPFEVGIDITYPASSIKNDFNWNSPHPLVIAYENYLPMPYDRPTWDLTSVLYAVEGNEGYFTMSERGKITVDENGYTSYTEDPKGHHQYLKVTPEQASKVRERFIDLVSSKPKNRNLKKANLK